MGELKITGIRDLAHNSRLLFWDVETSSIDIKHRTYDLKVMTKRFDPSEIERDWNILSVAWAFNDDPVKCVGVSPASPFNDFEVVSVFHNVLDQADYLIGHNIDAFDRKKFNTRAAKWGLSPIGPKATIDTLKLARKEFRFTSNKLRYIAEFFGIQQKDDSPDWDACLRGDRDALGYMRQYNKNDVDVTRQLYYRLAPYHTNHPNMNLANPPRDVEGNVVNGLCPACGSPRTKKDGYAFTNKTKYQKHVCHACAHRFRSLK